MVRGSSPSGSSSRKRSPSPQGGSKTSPSLKKRTSPGGGAPSKTSASASHPPGQLAEAPTTKGHGSPARAPAYLDTLKFIVGVTGIFVMYGIFYSDSQKALTSKQGDGTKFTQTAFVMLFQCAGNALFSLLAHGVTAGVFQTCTVEEEAAKPGKDGKLRPVVPFLTVLASQDAALVSLAYVFAMYTSNRALEYVSFPFQILAKSCKMIPVMLGSILLLRKRYSLLKVASVLIMTAGVVAFSAWEKKKGAADDSAWGIALLVVSLVLDGAGGPLQEGMKKYPLTAFLQNLVSNVWAIVYMGLVVAVNNEFFPAVSGRWSGGDSMRAQSACTRTTLHPPAPTAPP